jgi:hypothetical protein
MLENKLFDPQRDELNKHVNTLYLYLLAQMVLDIFN